MRRDDGIELLALLVALTSGLLAPACTRYSAHGDADAGQDGGVDGGLPDVDADTGDAAMDAGVDAAPPKEPRVLIVGIDGCRGDALETVSTPAVDGLIANGTYTYDAQTVYPSMSGPCWSSMLTGVRPFKHDVWTNSFTDPNYAEYPPFFERVEAHAPSLNTASIVNWDPINDTIVGTSADFTANAASDAEVRDQGVDRLANHDPHVLFLAFDSLDAAGHAYGYGAQVPEYVDTLETLDGYVDELVAAMEGRATYDDEDWLVIVTADHGGLGNGHGGTSPEEMTIPFVASGDRVSSLQLTPAAQSLSVDASVALNGVDEYLVAPVDSAFDFGAGQDFTVECWVRTTGWSGDPPLVSDKDWNSGGYLGFVVSAQYDGATWKVNVGDGANRVDVNGGVINDGAWHHVAAVFDRDGELTIYQDGRWLGGVDMSAIGDITTPHPLVVGQDGTQTYSHFYHGSIAEVRIWRAAVGEDEIASWAARRVDGSHADYAHLVGYWRLDEGSGTTLSDLSPNANALAYHGPGITWDTSGGTLLVSDYSAVPRVYDTAVTALAHLCIPIDPAWHLDGEAIGASCAAP